MPTYYLHGHACLCILYRVFVEAIFTTCKMLSELVLRTSALVKRFLLKPRRGGPHISLCVESRFSATLFQQEPGILQRKLGRAPKCVQRLPSKMSGSFAIIRAAHVPTSISKCLKSLGVEFSSHLQAHPVCAMVLAEPNLCLVVTEFWRQDRVTTKSSLATVPSL